MDSILVHIASQVPTLQHFVTQSVFFARSMFVFSADVALRMMLLGVFTMRLFWQSQWGLALLHSLIAWLGAMRHP